MSRRQTEIERQRFHARWDDTVRLFCRLYTGDPVATSTATVLAFERYFEQRLPLCLDHVPPTLMSLAIEESRRARKVANAESASDFDRAVLALEPGERTVFLLHSVVGLWFPWIAAVTGIPFGIVCRMWDRAVIHLRLVTVYDDCSRLFADRGALPRAADGEIACA